MNIGFVRKVEKKIGDEHVKWLELSVRVPGTSFSATLTMVKEKQGDNSPDAHLYWSPNRRGESFDRVRIGALWHKVSDKGNKYMNGYIESPIFPAGKIHISIVTYTPLEGKKPQPILYNVLWSPPRPASTDNYPQDYNSYTPPPQASYDAGGQAPAEQAPPEIDIDEEEIPF